MTSRKQKNVVLRRQPAEPLRVSNPHAAGIDVHAAVHWVAVPPEAVSAAPKNHPANLPPWVRSFGTCTADLEMLADWLKESGVTTVAMEATGEHQGSAGKIKSRRIRRGQNRAARALRLAGQGCHLVKGLARKAQEMGYQLVPTAASAPTMAPAP